MRDSLANIGDAAEPLTSGFRRLDAEHNLQLSLLTAFRRALTLQRPDDELDEILVRLVDFTKLHYASEQSLMRLYGYPHIDEHVAHHDRSLDRLQQLQGTWRAGDPRISDRIAIELGQSIEAHIHGADRALAQFLTRLGVGPG